MELLAVCAAALGRGGMGRAVFVQDVGDFGYSLEVGARRVSFHALTLRKARRALEDEAVHETMELWRARVPRAKTRR